MEALDAVTLGALGGTLSRKLLMVAFHFPPVAYSSGGLRTLKFSNYLPRYGWDPLVLTVAPGKGIQVNNGLTGGIASTTKVFRAAAYDAKEVWSIRGRYPSLLDIPDRFGNWIPRAILLGRRLIRELRPDAIWSTYPIASSHVIAHSLARHSGLPWIAEFRDPMFHEDLVGRWGLKMSHRHVEKTTLKRATRVVFVTESARASYLARFPERSPDSISVIANGYDEEDFVSLPATPAEAPKPRLTLLHSGVLYPEGRNATPFLEAAAALITRGVISAGALRIVFRACGDEVNYQQVAKRLGLESVVELAPSLPYHAALQEMSESDGLLLVQGTRFDRQVPAKLYEYLRIGRPVIGLVAPSGETASELVQMRYTYMADPDRQDEIERVLERFIVDWRGGTLSTPPTQAVSQYSRVELTRQLAQLLDSVISVRSS